MPATARLRRLLTVTALFAVSGAAACAPLKPSTALQLASFDAEQDWPELAAKTQCWDVFSIRRNQEALIPLAIRDSGQNGQGTVVAHLALRPDGKSVLLTSRNGKALRSPEVQGKRLRNRGPVPVNGPAQRGDSWNFTWQASGLRYTFTGVVEAYNIWQRPTFGGLQRLTPAEALKSDGPFVDETQVVGQLTVCQGSTCSAQTVVLSTGCEN